MDKPTFLEDLGTQPAVIFNLVILGEAAGNVLASHPSFAERHAEIPWRIIRATRHANLDVLWDTAQAALPQLLRVSPAVPPIAS